MGPFVAHRGRLQVIGPATVRACAGASLRSAALQGCLPDESLAQRPEHGQPRWMIGEATAASLVAERQDPLRERYKEAPGEALITDRARTAADTGSDPFRGNVIPGSEAPGVSWPLGIHRAVGGYHDQPNPGDLLCAALAACLDSTIRIIANRLRVMLTTLEVDVAGDVDLRGTLLVDRRVPVGFQKMRCRVHIRAAEGTDPKLVGSLLAAAEHSCINLQTLRSGVPVETSVESPP